MTITKWDISGAPGEDQDAAADLLDALRAAHPPTLARAAVIEVIRAHLECGDTEVDGDVLLDEILGVEARMMVKRRR